MPAYQVRVACDFLKSSNLSTPQLLGGMKSALSVFSVTQNQCLKTSGSSSGFDKFGYQVRASPTISAWSCVPLRSWCIGKITGGFKWSPLPWGVLKLAWLVTWVMCCCSMLLEDLLKGFTAGTQIVKPGENRCFGPRRGGACRAAPVSGWPPVGPSKHWYLMVMHKSL